MNGKRGLIAALIALVAVVALAAFAYNALAGQAQQQTSAATSSSNSDTADSSDAESGAAGSGNVEGAAASESDDVKLPGFTVSDIEGNEVSLDDLLAQGKPVFLGYWATWCPPCMEEAPEIQKLYDKYGDKVVFAMVNPTDGTRETEEGVTTWYQEQGFSYPIYLDKTLEASTAAGIMYLPTTYMLDAQGNILYSSTGALTLESGSEVIENALAS